MPYWRKPVFDKRSGDEPRAVRGRLSGKPAGRPETVKDVVDAPLVGHDSALVTISVSDL
jgi:hypothetical protein